jgi:hypothetical protein
VNKVEGTMTNPSNSDNDRIDELKRRANEAAAGKMVAWESDALSPEVQEQFWRRLVAWETAPTTTNFQQLADLGVTLKEPDAVGEEELRARLWELIDGLAGIRVFLMSTDHLSDRELYARLWHDVLRDEIPQVPDDPGVWHVDLVGTGSEADVAHYLKYYADEDSRRLWLERFPDEKLPMHEDPPYDRDRLLPEPPFGR